MSQIPSDIAASAAQTGVQARQVTNDREVRRAGQAHAASQRVKTVNDADTTVETTNADVEVFTNAEGQGSQGRQLDQLLPPQEEPAPPAPPGITTGEDGRLHVDLEA